MIEKIIRYDETNQQPDGSYVLSSEPIELIRCKDCCHRDPESKKCRSGQLERAGCIFPVADDYFCLFGEMRDGLRGVE